jgi:hypothetical protein
MAVANNESFVPPSGHINLLQLAGNELKHNSFGFWINLSEV